MAGSIEQLLDLLYTEIEEAKNMQLSKQRHQRRQSKPHLEQ